MALWHTVSSVNRFSRVMLHWFETNVDNYGEVYVDGKIDRVNGVITGNNVGKRIQIEDSAVPGSEHVIAVFVCNAPLAEPVGTIFMRYTTLAIE